MKEDNEITDESTVVEPTIDERIDNESEDVSPDTTDDNELHALDIAPSMSRTTNIPPRLPEGYSYTSQPVEPEQKPQPKAKPTPEPTTDQPLRSEPSEARSKRYRAHKPNKTWRKTKRVARRYGWLIIFPAIIATYPLWIDHVSSLFHSEEPAPAVAADTVPQLTPAVEDTVTTVPQLTHEDSLRIQDSIRHARWVYWQRNKKRQTADDNAANEEVVNSETESATTQASATSSMHNGAVRRDSL